MAIAREHLTMRKYTDALKSVSVACHFWVLPNAIICNRTQLE